MPTKKNSTKSPLSQKAIKKSEKYALLSVWNKTGIIELAKEISGLGFQIISSGGTAKVLKSCSNSRNNRQSGKF